MAYLCDRHRGKHLLPVGMLVLCNKMMGFSQITPGQALGRHWR